MADLDKVLKGLAHCTGTNGCFECPYSDDGYSATVHCKVQVDRDALELLKSQQAESELLKEYRWIPKEEQMPDEPGVYLVSGGGKVWLAECAFMMGVKGWCNHANNPMVEAWMPVPRAFVRG